MVEHRSPKPRAAGSNPATPARSLPGPREGLAAGIALALLACLPFLAAHYPQLTDYPSHLARYHVMLDGGHDPWLARYYAFDWRWSGNLGADLLIQPLAALFGLETAGRILGALIPPLTGLGIITVEWTLRRRVGVASMLALNAIWSPPMGMGFYNFCLSVALALFAFALWVKLEYHRARAPLFLVIAPIVFLSHVSGWGVLGVLVLGYEFSRNRRVFSEIRERANFGAAPARSPARPPNEIVSSGWPGTRAGWCRTLLAPWPLTLPFLLLIAQTGETASLGGNTLNYKLAIAMRVLRDQSMPLDIASLALLVCLLLAATLRRKIDPRLAWAALLLGILSLALPRHLAGGDYADFRLMPVALMIGCLSLSWQAPRWALYMAPLLFLTRLGVTTHAWAENSRETAEAMKALDHVPRGARLAGAVLVDSRGWALNPFEHAPSYASVRRSALVNTHFAAPGVHMLQMRTQGWHYADPTHRLLQPADRTIDLSRFPAARHADYLWYFGPRPPDHLPEGAMLLHQTRQSALYRLGNSKSLRPL